MTYIKGWADPFDYSNFRQHKSRSLIVYKYKVNVRFREVKIERSKYSINDSVSFWVIRS